MGSKRVKLLRVPTGLLLHSLLGPGEVPRAVVTGIPEGWKAEDIHHDYNRDLFVVRICHESFPEIEPGEPIPELDGIIFHEIPRDENKVKFREFF